MEVLDLQEREYVNGLLLGYRMSWLQNASLIENVCQPTLFILLILLLIPYQHEPEP